MRESHATLCAALVIGSGIICGIPAAQAQTPVNAPDSHMVITVPSDSMIVTRSTPGAQAKHSPGWVMDVGGPTVNGFRTNFNVMVSPAKPGVAYNLAGSNRMSGELKQAFPSARNITMGTATVGGEPAAFVSGIITMPKHVIHTKIVQLAHKGTRYTMTFSTDEKVFYKQVGNFDRALASVKWN